MADTKGTALAFGALGVATLFVVSGIKGTTLSDVLQGKANKSLDPTGGVSSQPIDTGKYDINDTSAGNATSTQAGQNSVLDSLKAEMDRMAGLHSYYQYGGSHLNYNNNGPWDCSSALSQALHKAGLLNGPPRVSAAFMVYGEAGPGAHVTIYANTHHCYMVVDGRTWAWSHTGAVGGYIDRMPTSGYVARHPEGL